MRIQEIEKQCDMTRANIRFYEEKGLLSPARTENGYRDYSQEDLRTLQRIRLLRSLGVGIEEIRALQTGEKQLDATLRSRMQAYERARREAAYAQDVCQAICNDRATYDTLDADRYLHYTPAPAKDRYKEAAKEDRRPYPFCAWRRFFARGLDTALYMLLYYGIFGAALRMNLWRESYGLVFIELVLSNVLVIAIEPVLLHFFGTTLGKWIFGLHVETEEGKHPDYGTSLARTGMVLLHGEGLFVPPALLWRHWRGMKACMEGEESRWDTENALVYVMHDQKKWRIAVMAAARLTVLFVQVLFGALAMQTPCRGDLTVAEFAQNYNHVLDFYGYDTAMRLDDAGNWYRKTQPGVVVIDLFDDGGPPALSYTLDESGHITRLGFVLEKENSEFAVSGVKSVAARVALAFMGAQDAAHALMFPAVHIASGITENTILDDCSMERYGVKLAYHAESSGFFDTGMDMAIASDEAESNHIRVEFVMMKNDV